MNSRRRNRRRRRRRIGANKEDIYEKDIGLWNKTRKQKRKRRELIRG